ncbi:hypothetical protein AJ80_07046 [Polytolypa hystricis UAMH7299]|uniref:Protein-lysine N-methyltransferase EFM4 n=1 Tax=Polytolypa hystricis (strain UAMH7299) TaxID=1447883 RepID=A0A2B7XQU0_POLH7|nr:hypothetical protein AJ80_07046 [Polytolypa hystricis UAMH7299]
MTQQHQQDTLPTHLEPSKLGTKEYWESFYENSLSHISRKKKRPDTGDDDDDVKDYNKPDQSEKEEEEQLDDSDNDDDEYSDNDSDPGTSWFSEHNAPQKVLRFLIDEAFPLAPCNTTTTTAAAAAATSPPTTTSIPTQPTILDLGTGNGSMLTLLRDEGGFTGDMVGVDYSEKSVELARALLHADRSNSNNSNGQQEQGQGEEEANVRFEVYDIFDTTDEVRGKDWFPAQKDGFDIVLDKGTFDAVSLSADVVVQDSASDGGGGGGSGEEKKMVVSGKVVQRRICETYPGIVTRLVRPGGFLVVTSCNWTEEELVRWFTAAALDRIKDEDKGGGGDGLDVWGRVEYPKFRFGGQEGQGVCTVCFQRRGGKS